MAESFGFSLRKTGSPIKQPEFTQRAPNTAGSSSTPSSTSSSKKLQFTNAAAELTRNSKYIVSKLTATPNALSSVNASDYAAVVDGNTEHALLIADETIYTWNYNSSDAIPATIQLPVTPPNQGFPPLALLTLPSAGSTEPGVVTINTHTGHVRFYENVGSASSIGLLQHHKGIDYLIKLYSRETVTLAEAIEPAGILLTTSFGRVILLSLRDSAGKPLLTISEIVHRQTGFFSHTLEDSRQIISMTAGPILGQGERVVATVTKGGDFQVWACSRDGQSKQVFQKDTLNLLVNYVSELYPNAIHGMEVLDLALLSNFGDQDVFLLLTSFQNTSGETYYVLFTIKKEDQELLIFSAYKINTYTTPYQKKPRLYVPNSGSTAFIVFENVIVLTELVTKLDYNLNLKRKWEDIITFRADVNIIGSGVENIQRGEEADRLPSIYAIVPKVGVLRVERLPSKEKNTTEIQSTRVIKSHIEQAVFYGEDQLNPIEFNLPENLLNRDEIEIDLLQVCDEILTASSSYLPPRLPSLEDHLELRQSKLQKLSDFAAMNFNDIISHDVKICLVSALEKVTAALNLQRLVTKYSSNDTFMSAYNKVLEKSKSKNSIFVTGLSELISLLAALFKRLNDSPNMELLNAEIVTSVFYPILETEVEYGLRKFGLDSTKTGINPPWFVSQDIHITIDSIFNRYVSVNPNNVTPETCVELAEILFYILQQKLLWLNNQVPQTREIQDVINRDQAFYEGRSTIWTKNLVLFDKKAEALGIAQTYRDLKSLVEISEEDRENSRDEELSRVNLRFDDYFHTFGYDFAKTLYNHYILTGKYQALLLGFPQYGEYLQRFFDENDYGRISWIKDIFDEDYTKASKILLNVAQKNDESQFNKHLQLSIAKLSVLSDSSEGMATNDDLLQDIQEELDFVEAQGSIFSQIESYLRSDSDAAAQVDSVVHELLKSPYGNGSFDIIEKSFARSLARLIDQKSLTVNEMTDVFTLLDVSKTRNKSNYFLALKLLHLSNLQPEEKAINEKIIWIRAILSDEWLKILVDGQTKSQEFNKEKAEGTILYQTLLEYFQDELFVMNNDYAISLPNISTLIKAPSEEDLLKKYKFVGQSEVGELQREAQDEIEQIKELIVNEEFEEWIKALIGTANEKSGANKVINYDQLVIENS